MLIVTLGSAAYSLYIKELKPYPLMSDKVSNCLLYGKINSVELRNDKQVKFTVTTDSLIIKGRQVKMNNVVSCRIRDENFRKLDTLYSKLLVGEEISLMGIFSKGKERRNPGEFDYQKYLEEHGVSGVFSSYNASDLKILYHSETSLIANLILKIRQKIDDAFNSFHTQRCASLLRGFLLADRSEVDEETKNDFVNTGVVHILAVSGSNVFFIVIIFTLLFGRLNIISRILLTSAGLIFFLMVTGTAPSVLRAVTMALVSLLAVITNRSYNVYNLLAIAALLILIISPNLLFDPGFQLSFSTVLSIVVFYPALKLQIENSGIKNVIISKILLFSSVTIAAQVGALPVVLYYFGKISIISLPANLLVIPLSGIITAVGILTLLLSFISPALAHVFSLTNNLFSEIMLNITHYLGNLRFSYLAIRQFSLSDVIIFYVLLLGLVYFYRRFSHIKAKIALTGFILLNLLTYCSLDDKELFTPGELNLFAIDVGQGDATLIRFPDNTTMLIDAGNATKYFDCGEKVIAPLLSFLGIDKIDYGVISHVDSDHYAGFISLINKGIIRKVFKPALDPSLSKDIKLEAFLKESDVHILNYRKGKLRIGNVTVYVLNPVKSEFYKSFDINNKSGIIKIVYGNTSFLFEGDAGKKEEYLLLSVYNNFLKTDFLKLGHHGSSGSSTTEFLQRTRPAWGLISAGTDNRFGHPSKEVLLRAGKLNIKLLRTDLEGGILMKSNGRRIEKIEWNN